MASNSAPSQQPFAHSQPTPASPVVTSPPTKQSLKSWAKWFKPPAKVQETHGTQRDSFTLFFFHRPQDATSRFVEDGPSIFQESLMSDCLPIIIGMPDEVAETRSYYDVDTFDAHDSRSIYRSSTAMPFAESTMSLLERCTPSALQKGIRQQLDRSHSWSSSRQSLLSIRTRQRLPSTDVSTPHKSNANNSARPVKKTRPRSGLLRAFDSCAHRQEHHANHQDIAVEQPTGIFGVPLRQSITYANVAISLVDESGKSYIYGYVPIVVAKCGVYLKEKGNLHVTMLRNLLTLFVATNVEGIFRLSGSEKRIKELRTIFDSPDRYGKGLDWAGYTVHDAANVLRRYLNQLPEPIVPLALYHQFREPLRGHAIQAVGDSEGTQLPENFDIAKAIATYQQLITELPPLNRQLLLYILDLLAVFASKADENRMNSQNLAAIFQPGMLSHPDHDMAPQEYRLSQDVLIFLIENQDHFLIGMRGTAADEQTVNDVQNGTPPPGTPSGKSGINRSASNASAGADDVRKYGGVRRNVSTSSRHSKQSNGAPSPASPAYGTPTSGVHRSNTVPSKRSPAIPSSHFQRSQGSPSPRNGVFPSMQTELPQSAATGQEQSSVPLPVTQTIPENAAPPSLGALQLPTPPFATPTMEKQPITPTREIKSFFARSPTAEAEKKGPNKLRKKRIPGAANESAQSSTLSLNESSAYGGSPVVHPAMYGKDRDVEYAPVETPQPATSENKRRSGSPRSEHLQPASRPQEVHQNSDQTLKAVGSPANSLRSHSSFNDLSHSEADDVAAAEQKEKRSRWRLSRRREDSTSFGQNLTPRRNVGSDAHAAASSSSIGSGARPRKSFTGDSTTMGTESTLVNTHNTQQSSNESGSAHATEEKKGPLGWIKNKMREKREEREAERERNKSPSAASDRAGTSFGSRSKSVDQRREESTSRATEQPPVPPLPAQSQPQPQVSAHPPPMQSIDEISTSQVLVSDKRSSQHSAIGHTTTAEKRLSQQSNRSQGHQAPKFQEQTDVVKQEIQPVKEDTARPTAQEPAPGTAISTEDSLPQVVEKAELRTEEASKPVTAQSADTEVQEKSTEPTQVTTS